VPKWHSPNLKRSAPIGLWDTVQCAVQIIFDDQILTLVEFCGYDDVLPNLPDDQRIECDYTQDPMTLVLPVVLKSSQLI